MQTYAPHGSVPHNSLKLRQPAARIAVVTVRPTHSIRQRVRPSQEGAVRIIPANGK